MHSDRQQWLDEMQEEQRRRRVSVEEQREMGLMRYPGGPNFVPAERVEVLPSHHEVHDPYAMTPALEGAQMVSHHHYHPKDRASAMLTKTSAITLALAIFTAAAMLMLSGAFWFFTWLVLASIEWVLCFLALAYLDYRETPASVTHKKLDGYLDLMRREQRARLRRLYGDGGD